MMNGETPVGFLTQSDQRTCQKNAAEAQRFHDQREAPALIRRRGVSRPRAGIGPSALQAEDALPCQPRVAAEPRGTEVGFRLRVLDARGFPGPAKAFGAARPIGGTAQDMERPRLAGEREGGGIERCLACPGEP